MCMCFMRAYMRVIVCVCVRVYGCVRCCPRQFAQSGGAPPLYRAWLLGHLASRLLAGLISDDAAAEEAARIVGTSTSTDLHLIHEQPGGGTGRSSQVPVTMPDAQDGIGVPSQHAPADTDASAAVQARLPPALLVISLACIHLVDHIGGRLTAIICMAAGCVAAMLFALAPAAGHWPLVAACMFNIVSVGGWNSLDLISQSSTQRGVC